MTTEEELRATLQAMGSIVGDLVVRNTALTVSIQQIAPLQARVAELEAKVKPVKKPK